MGVAFRKVTTIDAGDCDGANFQRQADGGYVFYGCDPAVRMSGASFADSAAPHIILHFLNGSFHLDSELMRKRSPSIEELKSKAAELAANPTWSTEDTPGAFWQYIIDLTYSGNSQSADQFVELSWPPQRHDKDQRMKDFREQLAKSPYWLDIQELNSHFSGGNLGEVTDNSGSRQATVPHNLQDSQTLGSRSSTSPVTLSLGLPAVLQGNPVYVRAELIFDERFDPKNWEPVDTVGLHTFGGELSVNGSKRSVTVAGFSFDLANWLASGRSNNVTTFVSGSADGMLLPLDRLTTDKQALVQDFCTQGLHVYGLSKPTQIEEYRDSILPEVWRADLHSLVSVCKLNMSNTNDSGDRQRVIGSKEPR
jgi:hypothetical protein